MTNITDILHNNAAIVHRYALLQKDSETSPPPLEKKASQASGDRAHTFAKLATIRKSTPAPKAPQKPLYEKEAGFGEWMAAKKAAVSAAAQKAAYIAKNSTKTRLALQGKKEFTEIGRRLATTIKRYIPKLPDPPPPDTLAKTGGAWPIEEEPKPLHYTEDAAEEIKGEEKFKPKLYNAAGPGRPKAMTIGSGIDITQNPNALDVLGQPQIIRDGILAGERPITPTQDRTIRAHMVKNQFQPDLHRMVGEKQFEANPMRLKSTALSDIYRGVFGPKQAKTLQDYSAAKTPQEGLKAYFENIREGMRHQVTPGELGQMKRSMRIAERKMRSGTGMDEVADVANKFSQGIDTKKTRDPRVVRAQRDQLIQRLHDAEGKTQHRWRNLKNPIM